MLLGRHPLPPWRTARADRVAGKVRITIAPRRTWFAWVAFATATCLWIAGGTSAYQGFLAARNPNRRTWLGAWLIVWTVWGLWALPRAALQFLGREIIEVDGRAITLRRQVAGIGRTRRFDVGEVRNLHLAAPPPVGAVPPPSRGWPQLATPLLAGSIRFEYQGRTHEFAMGIGWSDMTTVLQGLRERVQVASSSA